MLLLLSQNRSIEMQLLTKTRMEFLMDDLCNIMLFSPKFLGIFDGGVFFTDAFIVSKHSENILFCVRVCVYVLLLLLTRVYNR